MALSNCGYSVISWPTALLKSIVSWAQTRNPTGSKELLESPTNTLTASFDELFSTELPGKSPDEDGNIGEFLVRVQGGPDEQPDRGWSLRISASVLLNVISSMFNSRRRYKKLDGRS